MLNRLITARKEAILGPEKRRPYLATECTDVGECEKWRRQIIRSIARQVGAIQNGSLGEHKIRDMNDNINKLMREKKHWERQIKYLGGADYMTAAPRVTDADGQRALGANGYFYFGAARELPGVRELFERLEPEKEKKKRGELFRMVNADYYGYKDDDDGLLKRVEKKEELKSRAAAVEGWKEGMRKRKRDGRRALGLNSDDDEDDEASVQTDSSGILRAHVVLPSTKEMEALVLKRRKEALLAKLKKRKF